jgi:hypothetical protein
MPVPAEEPPPAFPRSDRAAVWETIFLPPRAGLGHTQSDAAPVRADSLSAIPSLPTMKTKSPAGAKAARRPRTLSSDPAFTDPQCAEIISATADHRRALGLSRYRVSKTSHLALSTICRIEKHSVVPRADALARYCRACHMQLEVRPM